MLGGVLISLSLGALVMLNGTRFSVGDMIKNTLERKPSVSWNNQILFLIGVLISPLIFTTLFYPVEGFSLNNEPLTIILSGLLVGSGSQLCAGGIITKATLGCANNLKYSIILIILFFVSAILTQIIINL